MTSLHNSSTHSFSTRQRNYVPSTASLMPQRKNSGISAVTTPVLSSFAIDLIAQFDNYRVNMRESLQREVEENIHKAKVLKEAMKESSDQEAELAAQAAEEQQQREHQQQLLREQQLQQQQALLKPPSANASPAASPRQGPYKNAKANASTTTANTEKLSRMDRIFGRKMTSMIGNQSSVSVAGSPSLRNHQVIPHPAGSAVGLRQGSALSFQQQQSPNQMMTILPNGSTTMTNTSAVDLSELKFLPVEEEDEEEEVEVQVIDRSMGAGVGSGSNQAGPSEGPGTDVKLHPTRAKTFALPKSLRNLKRRIAALRAKGTDLDAEQREKEEREKANGGAAQGEEKKKFTLIRLLPWKSSKKTAATTASIAAPTA